MASVPIAEAAGQLPALFERAEAGETVEITRDGKPAMRLVVVERPVASEDEPGKPFDWAAYDALIASLPPQSDSGEFVQQMRDEYRY
jgi:antitoxin (DNA-binding transcriptional repressor) of toxin-antitoxin stability system